jgi:tetratricopeptide (TPR) repeat protein
MLKTSDKYINEVNEKIKLGNLKDAYRKLSSFSSKEFLDQFGFNSVIDITIATAPYFIDAGAYRDIEAMLSMILKRKEYRYLECIDLITMSMIKRNAYDEVVELVTSNLESLQDNSKSYGLILDIGLKLIGDYPQLLYNDIQQKTSKESLKLWMDYCKATFLSRKEAYRDANLILRTILSKANDNLASAIIQLLGENLLFLQEYEDACDLYRYAINRYKMKQQFIDITVGCMLGLMQTLKGMELDSEAQSIAEKILTMDNAPEWAISYLRTRG